MRPSPVRAGPTEEDPSFDKSRLDHPSPLRRPRTFSSVLSVILFKALFDGQQTARPPSVFCCPKKKPDNQAAPFTVLK